MEITIPYVPHPKQAEIHADAARFKVVAAGSRSGKTILAVNEIIRQAFLHPTQPDKPPPISWYLCLTRIQAMKIAWRTLFKYLPERAIKSIRMVVGQVELVNGHIIEFNGAEDPARLRGVPLVYCVLDEYGFMDAEVWTDVVRQRLLDWQGGALFIGTPGPDGCPHFQDLYNQGIMGQNNFKSWKFHTTDNPYIQKAEIEHARLSMPPDIFKREYEADFDSTAGLIYDNFRNITHVIPNYEPDAFDFIVGSIDPGLYNPTAAILVAWDRQGTGRLFKEYYREGLLASENAENIAEMARPHKVAYWVIDRASTKRDQASGLTVFGKYAEKLRPLVTSPNDPNSVWAGIDEVKKLFHLDATGKPKLMVSALCHNTLWEIGRYIRYKRKWHTERNEEERPRKLNDHACDCIRNMVYSKPWIRPNLKIYEPVGAFYKCGPS